MPKENKKEILIVDDDEDLCTILSINLRAIAPIHHEHSLEGAMKYIEANHPSLVLLDNSLPDGYGVQHIARIKELNRQGKIILITSDTNKHLREESLSQGAQHFVCKPFSVNYFKDLVKKTMGIRS